MKPIAAFIPAALAAAAAGLAMLVPSIALSASPAYCDRYAVDYANRAAPPQGEIVRGAIGGAAVGAVIGGIARGSRGAGTGAAIGGTVGGVAGAAARSAKWNNAYNYAYNHCMGSSAYYGGRPEPWTGEWYAYCSAKYRSFNPNTGMYLTYSGRYRMCR